MNKGFMDFLTFLFVACLLGEVVAALGFFLGVYLTYGDKWGLVAFVGLLVAVIGAGVWAVKEIRK